MTGQGRRFIDWWADRLRQFCYDEVPNGLFTDQRWVDLAPAFFDDIAIVRDPQYNVATWNLTHRRATGTCTVSKSRSTAGRWSSITSRASTAAPRRCMLDRYGSPQPGAIRAARLVHRPLRGARPVDLLQDRRAVYNLFRQRPAASPTLTGCAIGAGLTWPPLFRTRSRRATWIDPTSTGISPTPPRKNGPRSSSWSKTMLPRRLFAWRGTRERPGDAGRRLREVLRGRLVAAMGSQFTGGRQMRGAVGA